MASKRVSARDFTVGWVCALPVELAAAEGIMDEQFAEIPSPSTDNNIYSYGRIKDHNVVIVCLPAGHIGTNSAATAASLMRSKFPCLRFGLLVGIGSGVPNLDDDIDIRLGDVVISQPEGQHGGVIQYDFGKTGANGRIARIGSLNAPPQILLGALSKLCANDFLNKTQIHVHLSKISRQSDFASPGPERDTLFEATSTHVTGATCTKCRPAVEREQRTTTTPVLFCGNIASGNQVMRDGPTRDKYSRDLGGVLCFEMWAAGLMNSFPCIVVRGICDYADAHKNEQWRPYAAATAASFGKELLCYIPPLMPSARHASENPLQRPHFLVPFGRNENFVGRETILMKLLKRIPPTANGDACPRTAIVGLGGIGKTQVAIEAAYRVREAHPDCSVFWVPAVSVEMFGNHYRKIGRALKLKNIEDPKADVKTLVRTALERDDINSWLLIVDNADDTGLLFNGPKLAAYIPYSRRGSILFTSRNSIIAARFDGVHALHLSETNAQEAARLLHTDLSESQIDNGRSTTQLLEKLTYLPLALKQASAYLKANIYTSISQYLEYCEASDEEQIKLLGEDFDDQYRYESIQNPVAKTWFISFDNIARDNPLAASYLGFSCHFAERYIPPALLPPGESERQTHEAISTLMAYAFIKKRHAAGNLEIHRLVRLAMQNWLKRQGKEQQQFSETLSASYTEKGSRLLSGLSKTRDTDFNAQFYVKKNDIEEAKATNQQSFQSNKQLLAPEQAVTQTVPERPAHGRKSQGETGEVPWIAQRHWH
ncbi:Regulatory protein AfsR [Colletotrichum fructicola Nara gc5]|uniref:Regulatory protein AfsR n=1 Tax=Colletotrichum fructicola (strain Nara gc5) TaxID=1213859 RepID=A0A7J6IDY5_COLFN|nr:Regulatory protein AfsR [Colletotrichum fructicola]KAF4474538.1 Regulatory protein AfsR [Colletotrichum fructicola Nara gc5]